MVISLDGRENVDYEAFTPTAASAILLDRFLGLNDGQEKPLGPLLDALKLYNDLKFREKADELEKERKKLEEKDLKTAEDEAKIQQLRQAHDASVTNILNELLRPG